MATTASEAAKRWLEGMTSGATLNKMKSGAESVTKSPSAAAAEKADTWQARVSSQEAKEKFVRKGAAVSVQDWKNAFLKKGAGRVASGAQEAKQKVDRIMATLVPQIQANAEIVRSMPNVTDEDRKQRMLKMFDLNKQIKIT